MTYLSTNEKSRFLDPPSMNGSIVFLQWVLLYFFCILKSMSITWVSVSCVKTPWMYCMFEPMRNRNFWTPPPLWMDLLFSKKRIYCISVVFGEQWVSCDGVYFCDVIFEWDHTIHSTFSLNLWWEYKSSTVNEPGSFCNQSHSWEDVYVGLYTKFHHS